MRDRDSNPRDPDSGGDLAIPRLPPGHRGPERILGINHAGSAGPDCARQRRSHAQRTARRMRAVRITRGRRGEGCQGRTPARRGTLSSASPARRFGRAPLAGRVPPGTVPRSYGCPGLPRLPAIPPRAGSRIPHNRCPLVDAAARRNGAQRTPLHGTAQETAHPNPRRTPSCARSPSSEPARQVSSSASA